MVFEEQVIYLSKRYFVKRETVEDTLAKAKVKPYVRSVSFPDDKAYRLTERYLRFNLYKSIAEE